MPEQGYLMSESCASTRNNRRIRKKQKMEKKKSEKDIYSLTITDTDSADLTYKLPIEQPKFINQILQSNLYINLNSNAIFNPTSQSSVNVFSESSAFGKAVSTNKSYQR
jgi:hypothetical protein